MATDSGTSLFDYLKIKFKIYSGCSQVSCSLPQNTWKDFRKQWVVLNADISPSESYLTYCPQEDTWLLNQHKLPKILLDRFDLIRLESAQSTKEKCHLELKFEHYSLCMEFKSMSKLQLWHDALEKINSRIYAELVRSPEHPEREKEYVIQLCTDRLIFYDPKSEDIIEFEWKINTIRRAHYHRVGKFEIEVGRASETGEGHFYFIGPNIKYFFLQLKEKIEGLSRAASVKHREEIIVPRSQPVINDTKPSSPQPSPLVEDPESTLSNKRESGSSSSAEEYTLQHVSSVTPEYLNKSSVQQHPSLSVAKYPTSTMGDYSPKQYRNTLPTGVASTPIEFYISDETTSNYQPLHPANRVRCQPYDDLSNKQFTDSAKPLFEKPIPDPSRAYY